MSVAWARTEAWAIREAEQDGVDGLLRDLREAEQDGARTVNANAMGDPGAVALNTQPGNCPLKEQMIAPKCFRRCR